MNSTKCGCGPGYSSPAEAIKGPREKILFVTAPHAADGHDAVFAVNVDPESEKFCTVLSRFDAPNIGDEVHHTGWNACSSCHENPSQKRTHLIVPCLNSDRIYILNVKNEADIFLEKSIEPCELYKFDVSFPHTSHCLADGNIMISTLGNARNEASGNFLLVSGKTFEPKRTWIEKGQEVAFNYDFWYQPRRNVMISTEWGSPIHIKHGFDPNHVHHGLYGHSIHLYNWQSCQHLQTIELPMPHGALPLEVRYLHEPTKDEAFVGSALGSSIFRIHPDPNVSELLANIASAEFQETSKRIADIVTVIPSKKVSGWILPEMPALITDIIISMDDHFLYVSCWLHGDIRQYDISDPANPKLNSQIYIGGSCHEESGVIIESGETIKATYVKDRRIEGGPQMLQLSLDGKRLYVTTSLYKKWDEQFYPKQLEFGSVMVQIDINTESNHKMSLNENFLIDFGKIEGGPYLAHEMRYPGGDCTSDIWI